MNTKALTAKINTARTLREKAQLDADNGRWGPAAEGFLRAGKLFFTTGERGDAEIAWRRACEFCEREANRIFQDSQKQLLS